MGGNLNPAEVNAIIAANQDMSNYLQGTIGILSATLRARLMVQGVTTPVALSTKPEKFISGICTIIRKQGGHSAYGLTHQVEELLHKFVRWCRYAQLVQRNLDYANATENALEVLSEWMDQLPDSDEAEMPDKFSDPSKVRNLLENIHTYLGIVKNKAGVPILYVIREDAALPADDPGFGMPDFNTEVMTRGRLNGVFWRSSNRTVWIMMRHICHGTHAWPFVSQFESTANGRRAYLAFAQHYMSTDIQHGIRTKANDILQNSKFTGESKNFTFDKFSARLTRAFNDSRPMPDEDKVIKLLNAFQVPSLEWAKGTISASPTYRTNYDAAVAFLAEQVRAKKPSASSNPRHLASLGKKIDKGKGNHKKKGDKSKWKFDPKHPSRYCPHHIYIKLDPEIKAKIRAARTNGGSNSMRTQVAQLTTQVAALTTALADSKKQDK